MTQYEIKTSYTIHGERVYYVEAKNEEDARAQFHASNLTVPKNLGKETVFTIEEFIKDIDPAKVAVDVPALRAAEEETMQTILRRSQEKLRNETGYGIPDEHN